MRLNRFKKIVMSVVVAALVLVGGSWAYYCWAFPHGWSHSCDKQLWFALSNYALDHGGSFPAGEATPEASLSLLYPKYADAGVLAGKTVRREVAERILKQGGRLGPETCGWHYVEGLREDADPALALFWDKARLGHNGQRRSGKTRVFLVSAPDDIADSRWQTFLSEQEQLVREHKQQVTFAANEGAQDKPLDPAAWGGDHVGQMLPEYVTGDECLFCHRDDASAKWSENRHQLTLRLAESEPPLVELLGGVKSLEPFAKEVELLLGEKRATRFLKKSGEYGKLDLLSVRAAPAHGDQPAGLESVDNPQWNHESFAKSCAGCHTTAVDGETHAFSALSIDCYACHGDVDLAHTDDTSLMLLSKKRKDPPRVVISLCGQCHIRDGKSRSTGLPYPNNFVAGDNLFRDFAVDFSDEHLAGLNPADRHVLENVRDVVIRGEERVTCLSCHNVHQQSAAKHIRVRNAAICTNCHNAAGPKSAVKRYDVHSATCEY